MIEKLRAPVCPENKLAEAGYTVQRLAVGKRVANSEHARKGRVRGANEGLGRHFELLKGEREWTALEPYSLSVPGEVYHLPKPNAPSSSHHQFEILFDFPPVS